MTAGAVALIAFGAAVSLKAWDAHDPGGFVLGQLVAAGLMWWGWY